MEKIRAIIVDDEKPARRRLRELLEKQPEIVIVAEYSNGAEAAPLNRKSFLLPC
jgi:chemotaxis response regulator CheB